MAGSRRLFWIGLALVLGTSAAHGQIVVGDPLNSAKTFSSYCAACHKSASGLVKMSPGSLSSFLRRHYTTGPEMSAAMAAYLVAAANDPRAARQRAQETAREAAARDPKPRKPDPAAAPAPRPPTDAQSAQRSTRTASRPNDAPAAAATSTESIVAPERAGARAQQRGGARPGEAPGRPDAVTTVAAASAAAGDAQASQDLRAAAEPAETAKQAEQPNYWESSP